MDKCWSVVQLKSEKEAKVFAAHEILPFEDIFGFQPTRIVSKKLLKHSTTGCVLGVRSTTVMS